MSKDWDLVTERKYLIKTTVILFILNVSSLKDIECIYHDFLYFFSLYFVFSKSLDFIWFCSYCFHPHDLILLKKSKSVLINVNKLEKIKKMISVWKYVYVCVLSCNRYWRTLEKNNHATVLKKTTTDKINPFLKNNSILKIRLFQNLIKVCCIL